MNNKGISLEVKLTNRLYRTFSSISFESIYCRSLQETTFPGQLQLYQSVVF